MNTPQRLLAWIGTACLLGTAALPARAVDGVRDDEIKIGMVNAQTGPAAGLGKGLLEGAQAVFRELNANGGVHGRKINLMVADDAYEPDNTVQQTLEMVQDRKVFALFGFIGTPTTNAVLPIVRDLGVPLVGVLSGARALRQPVHREVFNMRASYDDETEALVAQLFAGGARSVGVMYQYDSFGLAVRSGTERALQRRGSVVSAVGSFQRNTVAIRAALDALLEAPPDAIVMAGTSAPIAAFVKAARAAGLPSKLATVSFVGTDDLLPLLGTEGDGVLISQVVPFPADADITAARSCGALLAKHAGARLGFVNFEGCITAQLLVEALRRTGSAPTRDGLVQALNGMGDVDLGGIAVKLSPNNHQAMARVYLTEIRNSRIEKLAAADAGR